jgi:hypothetical protein
MCGTTTTALLVAIGCHCLACFLYSELLQLSVSLNQWLVASSILVVHSKYCVQNRFTGILCKLSALTCTASNRLSTERREAQFRYFKYYIKYFLLAR